MDRVSSPEQMGFPQSVDPSEVVWYDGDGEVFPLHRVNRLTSRRELVLWIDGACSGNGRDSALAGFGIYHGPESRFNSCGRLPNTLRQTSQAAEIHAAYRAITWNLGNHLGAHEWQNGVVIVTDSDYLFRGITDWVYKWEQNGYQNADGMPVINGAEFKKLHNALCYWEDQGLPIRFWKVPREQNAKADSLAESAVRRLPVMYT
jgi:ribonuclease HI